MDKNQSSEIHTSENESAVGAGGRRKFLQKASAGALIATIPAKSVWATGLTNSIVASGHGSDFAGGTMNLQDVYWWTSNDNFIPNDKFSDVFRGPPIGLEDVPQSDPHIKHVMTHLHHGEYRYAGPYDINRQLIATYLNALNHGSHRIHFPVVGPYPKPYATAKLLATTLYDIAKANPTGLASELQSLNNTKAVFA